MSSRLTSRRAGAGLVLLVGALVGCAQLLGGQAEIRQKRRFAIVAEPIDHAFGQSLRPYPVTVQLQPFSIAAQYNQLEIVTRRSPYEFRRDPLHVWGLRPRDMLTQVIADYLRGSQLFVRLVTERELLEQRPDYTIGGSIRALERLDSGDRWFARLELSMQLVRQSDGMVLWRGEILPGDQLEVYSADMQYVVQAHSEILRRKMEGFVRELDGVFLRLTAPGSWPAAAAAAAADSASATPAVAPGDTAAAAPLAVPDYYEIIPGKLAP